MIHADDDVMVNVELSEKNDFSVSDRGGSEVALAPKLLSCTMVIELSLPVQWNLDKTKSERTGK